VNTWKDEALYVLDPFQIDTGWFELELVGFQLLPNATLRPHIRDLVDRTIERLRLNNRECRTLREKYSTEYWEGQISHDFLNRHAPFIALELRRQGRLRAEDT
jgi:hypothetical protein